MQLGSAEHKDQFLQDLEKTWHENSWKADIQALEFEEALGKKRKEKAALDLRLSEKGKPPANEEKKALANLESDIDALQTAVNEKRNDKTYWQQRIELINAIRVSDQALLELPRQKTE